MHSYSLYVETILVETPFCGEWVYFTEAFLLDQMVEGLIWEETSMCIHTNNIYQMQQKMSFNMFLNQLVSYVLGIQ